MRKFGADLVSVCSAATGAAYGGQTGYAVAPAATAATYGTQRAAATGYDTAYQAAAATQGEPNPSHFLPIRLHPSTP